MVSTCVLELLSLLDLQCAMVCRTIEPFFEPTRPCPTPLVHWSMSQFGMVDQLLAPSGTKAFLPGYGPKHGGMPARWAVGKSRNSEVTFLNGQTVKRLEKNDEQLLDAIERFEDSLDVQ